MHLAAAFTQRDLQYIQVIHLYCQYVNIKYIQINMKSQM